MGTTGTPGQDLERFTSYMIGERKSPYTIKEYRFLVGMFLDFTGKPLKSVTTEDIEKYKNYLAVGRNYSKSSQYLAIKAVKLFYKSRNEDPPINLTTPKRSRKMPNYLTQREAKILLDASADDLKTSAMVSLLIYTGIRVGELCKIDVDDLNLEERFIRIRSGKGDKDRIVIIPDECASTLNQYLLERYKVQSRSRSFFLSSRKNRFDTSSVERIVRNLGKKANLNRKVTPHVLRHTFATTVLRNGGDIRFIQQVLGHASVATTQIYTHVDDNTLREMYEKHRPRFD
jgi:integrase/recombinase XerD